MDHKPVDTFKVYRSNWIPGLGNALAVITLQRETSLYPATERFVVVPTAPLTVESERWFYNGVPANILSDDQLMEVQRDAVEGFLIDFIQKNRSKFEDIALYHYVISHLEWREVDQTLLFHYNLKNSRPGQLAPALRTIRSQTRSTVLSNFLQQIHARLRDSSMDVETGSGDAAQFSAST
jgi:hypothetical protein